MLQYRKIEPSDDARLAEIIRANLKKYHLDVPGTAYYDPELDHLSAYYDANPSGRAYFVALGSRGEVIGGVGFAEFSGIEDCAELQKLYLEDAAKGKGIGKELLQLAVDRAAAAGYRHLYLETHTTLVEALNLYEKAGFRQIEKPCSTPHGTMDRFYLKKLLDESSR